MAKTRVRALTLFLSQLGTRGGIKRYGRKAPVFNHASAGMTAETARCAADRAGQAQTAGAVEKQQKPFPWVMTLARVPQSCPLPNGQYLPGTSSAHGLFNPKGNLHRGNLIGIGLCSLHDRTVPSKM